MAKLADALEAADKEFLSWLFREMRAQRVSTLTFKGLAVQMCAAAMPDPTKAELDALAAFAKAQEAEAAQPRQPDRMPPELAGPLAAARIMSGEAPPPWMRKGPTVAGQIDQALQALGDPTDPDRDIDDDELMGSDLPVEQ